MSLAKSLLIAHALLLVLSPIGARAEPLDAAACAQLREQKVGLINKGVPGRLQKGAMWAKANLDADKLHEVGEYLKIEAQLKFRCAGAGAAKKSARGWPRVIPLPQRNARRLAIKAVLDEIAKPELETNSRTGAEPGSEATTNALPAPMPTTTKTPQIPSLQ